MIIIKEIKLKKLFAEGIDETNVRTNRRLVFEAIRISDSEKGTEKNRYEKSNFNGIDIYVPKKTMGEEPIYIDQSKLGNFKDSFCKINPKINAFAKQNPDNLFFVMAIAVASQGLAWPIFREILPVYLAYIKDVNANTTRIHSIIGLDGKKYDKLGRFFGQGVAGRIEDLWRNRGTYYSDIYSNNLDDPSNEFELYKYISQNVNGLSTAKAAFATQLISGRLGCIDNINMDIYGIPVKIAKISNQKLSFKPPTSKKGSKELTKGGVEVLKTYIEFLKEINNTNNTNNISEILWDDWVQLSAAKAYYQSRGRHISLKRRDNQTILMPTYFNVPKDYQASLRDKFPDAEKTGDFGGSEISKDHFDIPDKASQLKNSKKMINR